MPMCKIMFWVNPLLHQLSKKNLRKILILPLDRTVQ